MPGIKRLSDEKLETRAKNVCLPEAYTHDHEHESPEDKVLASYLKIHGLGDRFRETYNHFAIFRIPKQFKNAAFIVPTSQIEVTFPGVWYVTPRHGGEILYPRDARYIHDMSYSARTFVRMTLRDGHRTRDVELDMGMLPVMVHSVLCNVHPSNRRYDLKPRPSASLDECAARPHLDAVQTERINAVVDEKFEHEHNGDLNERQLAIFIINGVDVIGMNIDRQRNAAFQVLSDTAMRFICPGYITSRVDLMLQDIKLGRKNKQFYSIHMHISDLLKSQTSHINILVPFYVAGWTYARTCQEFRNYVPENMWTRLRIDLDLANVEYEEVFSSDLYGYLRLHMRDGAINPKTDEPFSDNMIREIIFHKLFRHMNSDQTDDLPTRKLRMLLMMCGELLMHSKGIISPAAKDWQSKKVVTLVKNMQNLAQRHILEAARQMRTWMMSQDDLMAMPVESIQDEMAKYKFTQTFEKSLMGKTWGVFMANCDTKTAKVQYSERRSAENCVGAISQVSCSQKFINKQAKNFEKRSTGKMGAYVICPVESPTGERTGLTERFGIVTVISPGSGDDALIMRLRFTDKISSARTKQADIVLLINGKFMGWCTSALEAELRRLKRLAFIDPYTCISLITTPCKSLRIYTDDGRLLCPMWVVDEDTGMILADIAMPGVYDAAKLLRAGMIEFVDVLERITKQVVYTRKELVERTKVLPQERRDSESRLRIAKEGYDANNIKSVCALLEARRLHRSVLDNYSSVNYVPIHEAALLGTSASLLPLMQKNNTVRASFATKLQSQAITNEQRSHMDNVSRTMIHASRPVYETVVGRHLNFDKVHHTINCTVLVDTAAETEEDSVKVNKASIDRGFGMFMLTKGKEVDETDQILFGMLPGTEAWRIYRNIDPTTGFPLVDRVIRGGEVLVARVEKGVLAKDVHLPYGEIGTVKAVYVDLIDKKNNNNLHRVRIILKIAYTFSEGYKLAPPEGQKGVCGSVVPAVDMPVLMDRPDTHVDMIVNPAPFGGRMTVASMPHMLYGRAQSYGETWNATPFTRFDPTHLERLFIEFGLRDDGMERVMFPDGRISKQRAYVGDNMSVMLLHHYVQAKLHVRGHTGPRDLVTNQPPQGRNFNGGFRFSVMERDQLMNHGCIAQGLERMLKNSDEVTVVICANCNLRYEFLLFNQARCKNCLKTSFVVVVTSYILIAMQNLLTMANIKIEMCVKKY